MKKTALITAFMYAVPLLAFAQQDLGPIRRLVASIGAIIAMLVPILIALALVIFFWGLVKYIWGGTEADHSGGRKIMIAGLLSLFVMVSVWGIIRLAGGALGIDQGGGVNLPAVPVPGNSGASYNPGPGGYPY